MNKDLEADVFARVARPCRDHWNAVQLYFNQVGSPHARQRHLGCHVFGAYLQDRQRRGSLEREIAELVAAG